VLPIFFIRNEKQQKIMFKTNVYEGLDDKDVVSKMSLNEEIEARDTAAVPEPSCVSMKRRTSIVMPPNISDEAVTSDPRLDKH